MKLPMAMILLCTLGLLPRDAGADETIYYARVVAVIVDSEASGRHATIVLRDLQGRYLEVVLPRVATLTTPDPVGDHQAARILSAAMSRWQYVSLTAVRRVPAHSFRYECGRASAAILQ